MGRFDDRTVLVTGSTRGIGFAVAGAFLAEGATVVVNGRDAERCTTAIEALAAEHPGSRERLIPAPFDVADDAAVHAALADVPPVDVLVNNAGVQRRGPLLDLDLETWREVVDIDLTAALVVAREVVPGMIERGTGSIVNICSVQSSIVRPSTAPYAAAKTGLAGLTRSMCAEWAPRGIRANGIAPGYIATELNEPLTSDPEFSAWIERRTPAGRWGREDDLTGPILWLASDDARFVNGQIIYVDGGLTAVI